MKGVTRIVLVEPIAESRAELQVLLESAGTIRLAESCAAYDGVAEVVERVRPDLVVLGLDADPARAETMIPSLSGLSAAPAVLPASRSRDGDLILRVIRAGAREFLALPTTGEELAALVGRIIQSRASSGAGGNEHSDSRMLAVIGPGGGLGCTSLAVNLAVTLAADASREVVLADFDLLTGSVDVCLDLIPDQTIADVARSISRLDPTLLTRSLARHSTGLYVLPCPSTIDEAAKIDPDSLRPVLEMLTEVFPRVVVDLSKALQASDVMALEMADEILMVVQLEPACLRNGARLLGLFRQFDGMIEKVKVVANRVGATTCEVGVKKAEELLKVPIRWQVVNDPKSFAMSRSKGVPLEAEAAGSRAHRAIIEIARDFEPGAGGEKGRSLLGRFAASFF